MSVKPSYSPTGGVGTIVNGWKFTGSDWSPVSTTNNSGYATGKAPEIPVAPTEELINGVPASVIEAQRAAFAAGLPQYSSDITKVTSPLNVSQGSDQIRSEVNGVKSAAQTTLDNINTNQTQLTIDDLKKQINYRDPNTFTASELADIESTANVAGAQYDPEIAKAIEARRAGLPKSIVNAGEVGGLMNTQFAGAAALSPTEGGSWIGTGGQLDKIASDYDRNIDSLKTAKQQAIDLARAKAKEALRTGKVEDNKQAMQLFQLAQDANTKAIDLAQKKVDLVSSLAKSRQTQIDYNLGAIDDLAKSGQALTPDFANEVDSIYGKGFADKYYQVSKQASTVKTTADQAKMFDDIYSLLKNVPVGKKLQIGDSTYEGMYTADPNTQLFSETDNNGNVTILTVDKLTGKIIGHASGGKVGKSSSGSGGGVSTEQSQALLDSRDSSGNVSTALYGKMYDAAALKGAKALSDFTKQFPPDTYLNPKDPLAKRYLVNATQALSGGPKLISGSDNPFAVQQ